MSNEIIQHEGVIDLLPEILEKLVLEGDISRLNPLQKVVYYNHVCKKLNLEPATKPFQIINFQKKEILYATKDCTEQLRKNNGVSICGLDKLFQDGLYIVTATAQDKNGRQDAATGAVSITGLKGDSLANAIMKAETKAKRRVTLSICGLGMLDESETDTIGSYKKIDITTGEVIENASQPTTPILKQNPHDFAQAEAKKKEILETIQNYDNLDGLLSFCDSVKDEVKAINDPNFSKLLKETFNIQKKILSEKVEQTDIPQ